MNEKIIFPSLSPSEKKKKGLTPVLENDIKKEKGDREPRAHR
jgi:hypothetical protein